MKVKFEILKFVDILVLFFCDINVIDENSFSFRWFGLLKLLNFLKFLKEYVLKLVLISKDESIINNVIGNKGVLENDMVLNFFNGSSCKELIVLVYLKN